MKGRMYYYKDMFKLKDRDRCRITEKVVVILKKKFSKTMGYPAEEIHARREEVAKDARELVVRVSNGIPPGHVIMYPVIIRSARIYNKEREPWHRKESKSPKKHS